MCFSSGFPVGWSSQRQGPRILPRIPRICRESMFREWIQRWMMQGKEKREREGGEEGRRCAVEGE